MADQKESNRKGKSPQGSGKAGNKSGVRKQGGPKQGRAETGLRASTPTRKRSGSKSGGGKAKTKGR